MLIRFGWPRVAASRLFATEYAMKPEGTLTKYYANPDGEPPFGVLVLVVPFAVLPDDNVALLKRAHAILDQEVTHALAPSTDDASENPVTPHV